MCIKIKSENNTQRLMNRNKKRFILLLFFLIAVGVVNNYLKISLDDASTFLNKFSLWETIFIYILIYVLGTTLLPLSKDILKVIGAVSMGAVLSSLGIWIAEIINASILFYLARSLGRGFVRERLKGKIKRLDEKIGSSGFKGILILRLVPLIPYRVLDLLAGVSAISFIRYFVIVVIGSPLRIFWIQYILAGVGIGIFKNPSALVDYIAAEKLVFIWSLIYFILAIIVVFRLKFKQKI